MKHLFLAFAVFLSTGCVAQEVPAPTVTTPEAAPQTVVLVRCVYKYDSRYNIEFYEQDKSEHKPAQFPELVVYRITDTKGNHWQINQYDWANYTCTKTNTTKG
jgi:hypothetical protein